MLSTGIVTSDSLHWSMHRILEIHPRGASPYPVLCGPELAEGLREVWQPAWRQAALIGDDNTLGMFGEHVAGPLRDLGVEVLKLSFAPGEASKTRATKQALEDAMLRAGLDRQAVVVGLGGGIVLDIAGFVAATFMRGIDHVFVATTLLAQVDASVGGKTGVNTVQGKNLIGAFHHPRAVLLDTSALAQLPPDELRNGLAEAIKHALIEDAALFASFEAWAANGGAVSLRPPLDVIAACVGIKAQVVADDPREHGRRKILNFGHTVGHAIEHATAHAMPHGQAVAVGMVVEARLALARGRLSEEALVRLVALLTRLGLPIRPPCGFAAAAPYFGRDKKNHGGDIHCALPSRIGEVAPVGDAYTVPVAMDEIREAWGS